MLPKSPRAAWRAGAEGDGWGAGAADGGMGHGGLAADRGRTGGACANGEAHGGRGGGVSRSDGACGDAEIADDEWGSGGFDAAKVFGNGDRCRYSDDGDDPHAFDAGEAGCR